MPHRNIEKNKILIFSHLKLNNSDFPRDDFARNISQENSGLFKVAPPSPSELKSGLMSDIQSKTRICAAVNLKIKWSWYEL